MNDKSNKKIKYVFMESILASGALGFAIPIMTIFWNSIGMNQTMIGVSQMMCTIAILLLDIPMGYIADRYNRKSLNIIGDVGLAITFILYMYSNNFWNVIIAEALCGAFSAMTNGVDSAFLKFYSDRMDPTGKLFVKNNEKLRSYQFVSLVVAIFIGMFISKYSIKACLGIVSMPFIIASIFAFLTDDIGEKNNSDANTSNIKGMYISSRKILKNRKLKWLIIANGLSSQSSHAIVWLLTPLLIMVGVPVYIVGIGWIMNYIAPVLGSIVARKLSKFKVQNKFIVPFVFTAIATLIIYIWPNIITVWFFALTGFARGFNDVLMLPLIQKNTEDKYQTTVVSITSTISRLIYIPLVYFVNMAANDKPQTALLVNILIFVPFVVVIYCVLRKLNEDRKATAK